MRETDMPSPTFIDDARFYVEELGLSILPLVGKQPPEGFTWKPLTKRFPTAEELQQWASIYRGMGIICGRISKVVNLDADSRESVAWVERTLPPTSMMTATSTGKRHFYYRLAEGQVIPPAVKVGGMQLDVRGEVSYGVAAHSIHPDTGRPYERVGSWRMEDAPFFDPSWFAASLPERKRIPDRLAGDEVSVLARITRARLYLARLESAISGQGGHNRTMYAASCLVQKFGLTIEQAWPLMLEFNDTKCSPKWTARELLHKLESAVHNLQSQGTTT